MSTSVETFSTETTFTNDFLKDTCAQCKTQEGQYDEENCFDAVTLVPIRNNKIIYRTTDDERCWDAETYDNWLTKNKTNPLTRSIIQTQGPRSPAASSNASGRSDMLREPVRQRQQREEARQRLEAMLSRQRQREEETRQRLEEARQRQEEARQRLEEERQRREEQEAAMLSRQRQREEEERQRLEVSRQRQEEARQRREELQQQRERQAREEERRVSQYMDEGLIRFYRQLGIFNPETRN